MVIDFYNFCREVCVVILEQQSEPIGGPGCIVEIDESKFGKRKFNRGKHVDGVWVFGGIERDSEPPRCFFVTVMDRSADTLIPIIKHWILPGTTIYSDCWRSYSTLASEGYLHATVNHSVKFKSESGTQTNNIESRWNAAKKSLPRFGTRKDFYNSYFAKYCIRRKFLDGARDKFLQFSSLIGSVYKPPHPQIELFAQAPPPTAQLLDGLLSAPHPEVELFAQAPPPTAQLLDGLLSAPVSSAPPTSMFVGDVADFDIGFHISVVDSDTNCDMDTSGDMFL